MQYEDIFTYKLPTLTGTAAVDRFFQFLSESQWRCYSSVKHPSIDYMINAFISLHAEMPGIVTESLKAMRPIWLLDGEVTLGYENNEVQHLRIRGAIYSNGAFFEVSNLIETNVLLFVDDRTAQKYSYPVDNYIRTADAWSPQESAVPTHPITFIDKK